MCVLLTHYTHAKQPQILQPQTDTDIDTAKATAAATDTDTDTCELRNDFGTARERSNSSGN